MLLELLILFIHLLYFAYGMYVYLADEDASQIALISWICIVLTSTVYQISNA